MRRMAALVIAVAVLAACGEPPDPPGWTRLANGLRVCVKKVDGATNVAVLTVFDVGSDHDPVGQSGLAHLTEHLYVSSAAGATPARTSDEWFAAHPDGCDARTNDTFTQVLTVVAPVALDAELTDAAARMDDLRIEATDLDRERPRVLEQVAEESSDVDAATRARQVALDRLRPRPYDGHGVGVKEQVEKLTLDEIRGRARRLYRPVNARIVVTGAVDEGAVRALVEKRFAGIARGERIGDPELPGPSLTGTFELPDAAPPAASTDVERAVCVAYPASSDTAGDGAAFARLTTRAMAELRAPDLVVVPSEHAVTFTTLRGNESADDVVRRVDALIARAAETPPTDAELQIERKWFGGAVVESIDPKSRAAAAASFAALAARSRFGVEDVAAALGSLTKSDLDRYVSTWFVPAKRVVVTARAPAKPKPSRRSSAPRPSVDQRRGPPPDLDKISEVRVAMIWDETTRTIHRKIGDREYADDGELQKAIAEAHDAWVKKGKPDAPVTIDADSRVPWKDVINVVNIIKRCGIQRVEFAMGAPPKKPSPK